MGEIEEKERCWIMLVGDLGRTFPPPKEI